MAINDFVFQNTTKIYFGKEQLENLPNEIKKFGTRVMLTYGGGSIKRIGLGTLRRWVKVYAMYRKCFKECHFKSRSYTESRISR